MRAFSRLSASFWGSVLGLLADTFARFLRDFEGEDADNGGSN
jgi:hypothetical protein